jgi:hypothetical protein
MNTNTVLIVVVIVILLGGGFWWYNTMGPGAPEEEGSGLEIEIGETGGN